MTRAEYRRQARGAVLTAPDARQPAGTPIPPGIPLSAPNPPQRTRIHLHGGLGYPVWIAIPGVQAYYRADMPAWVAGGKSTDCFSLLQAGQASLSPAPVSEVLKALPSIRDLSIFSPGNPLIFCPVQLPRENLITLISAINAAGGNAWIEVDDDLLSLPASFGWQLIINHSMGSGEAAPQYSRQMDETLSAQQAPAKEYFRRLASVAKGIIVSTPYLAEVLRPLNPQVRVLPNLINPDHFVPVRRPSDGIVRIGYAGSATHNAVDFALAWPGLAACARSSPVELHFWGVHPRFAESRNEGTYQYEGVVYHYHRPLPFFAYHQAIGMLDVATAPLADIPFNYSKSPCKWLEHSLHDTPMVVSDLEPYRCVEDGVTGLKARTAADFAVQLHRLVQDVDLRRRIGRQAHDAVVRQHTPDTQGPAICAMFQDLRRASPQNLLQGLDGVEIF